MVHQTLCVVWLFIGYMVFHNILIVSLLVSQNKAAFRISEQEYFKTMLSNEIQGAQLALQKTKFIRIGFQLVDNLGQLLTVVKINLAVMEESFMYRNQIEFAENMSQANELVNTMLSEIRTLNSDIEEHLIKKFDFIANLSEALRTRHTESETTAELIIEGKCYCLGYNREIILFSIIQDIFLTARQCSETKKVEVKLSYFFDNFTLCLTFDAANDYATADTGIYALRATLINFEFGVKTDSEYRTQYCFRTTIVNDSINTTDL
ncbi:hypothetical protein [Emticicia sp. 21SJ11W-3]|uniref:hypothetical protein n=1 Tax=Emticicia sp. 21SJ11W-3 TaxID=2916755 RepID=UPI0020A05051|nr:hypothetical protein [Emticicia sp. 21SJ11W-3]UTA69240.1 hypothetical protein MB380_05410 [Emticicia sp. 21SJ11W-3]